jgi:hypothetical protein
MFLLNVRRFLLVFLVLCPCRLMTLQGHQNMLSAAVSPLYLPVAVVVTALWTVCLSVRDTFSGTNTITRLWTLSRGSLLIFQTAVRTATFLIDTIAEIKK